MSNSLRVLTYNTQMRSWGMEVGAQGDLFPEDSTEERAKTIARRILESSQDYDIICLNEVFDEDAREVFKSELEAKYPNIVVKADVDNLGLQIGLVAGGGIAAIAALAIPVVGWLAAAGIVVGAVIELLDTKFEDSGLMIFSRLPFDTTPLTPEMKAIVEPLGFTQADFPIIQYVPYKDATGGDANAAKGVVYARFILDNGDPLHLLASHTQADATKSPGLNAGVRDGQLAEVWELIERMVGPAPFTEEVVFCGDLNIDGCFHRPNAIPSSAEQEWQDKFHGPASNFTLFLHDTWYYEQCPGFDSAGTTLLPDFFDRGVTSRNVNQERLDYFLRPLPFPNRLATQHIAIAWDIAQEQNPAFSPRAYTSDHLPLRLDLNLDRPRASLVRAEQIPISTAHPDRDLHGVLIDGQMDWFRIDEPGAYGIRLDGDPDRVGFMVYGANDLSSPLSPFTILGDHPGGQDDPFGSRFVLPDPPFLIRVFLKKRDTEADYRLRVHKFLGTSELDAIPILLNVPTKAEARTGAPHSIDNPSTPWSEHDSVWFCFQLDNDDDNPIDARATFTISQSDQGAFGILVLSRDETGHLEEIAGAPTGDPTSTDVSYHRTSGGLVLAQRRNEFVPFTASHFTILLTNNITYVYPEMRDADVTDANRNEPRNLGHGLTPANLFCEDESDGIGGFLSNEWGSDDISFNVAADGRLVLHVDNCDELEFDDDSQRGLNQWWHGVTRYVNELEFELVEVDDLSPADRTIIKIPPYDQLVQDNPPLPDSPRDVGIFKFKLVFEHDDGEDDGVYHLTLTVSSRPPSQKTP